MPIHPIQLAGIDHIVLRTSDPTRLVEFYTCVLGCSIEWERPDLGLVHLRAGKAQIDILGDHTGPSGDRVGEPRHNLEHFCLSLIAFDERMIRAHLDKHQVIATPASQRFGAHGWATSFYIQDPDGNRIELKNALGPPGPIT